MRSTQASEESRTAGAGRRRGILASVAAAALVLTGLVAGSAAAAPPTDAPGGPGVQATGRPGPSRASARPSRPPRRSGTRSRDGALSEVYYPRGDGANVARRCEFVGDRRHDVRRPREPRHDARRPARRPAAHLPPGQHRQVRPLPAHQDLRHRPRPVDAARGPLRVARRQAVPGVRAVRPVAGEQRPARLRDAGDGALVGQRRDGGQRARRRPGFGTHVQRLRRHQRRLDRPGADRRWTGTTPARRRQHRPDGELDAAAARHDAHAGARLRRLAQRRARRRRARA